MSLKLDLYIDDILKVRCAYCHGNRIMAKPILLFAVIAYINSGVITKNKILFNNNLADSYKTIWNLFYEINVTPMWKPYYYLSSDGFWHLKWKENSIHKSANSAKFIRDNIEYAYFDDELWELLQEEETRKKLLNVLVKLIRNS
ncbi:MAG: hypothetical protein ACLTOV_00060 [Phocaeicola sp.]